MRESRRSSRRISNSVLCGTVAVSIVCLAFAGCGHAPATVSVPAPSPTPDPHEQTLIEHTVNERLAQENRVTEQQLVNARAAASQRMVGRQMLLKLEGQYRERQAELSGNSTPSPVLLAQTQAQPSASPVASASPQALAPLESAAKPDPKLQKPPVEDHADSMESDATDQGKATPIPSPTAPSASPNRLGEDKLASPIPKPTASPK